VVELGIVFPCEIVSWQVMPAVRREIAKYLAIEKKIPRKTIAKKLGITEAAVCQYIKHKRGGNYKFNQKDIQKIKQMADMIMQSEKGINKLCFVCKEFDASSEMLSKAGMKITEARI
jgi:hypothetical protein